MTAIKINEQIAFLRKQKGLTQKELAVALGVTDQAVSKWESAQCCPDIQLLPDIADYFGVSIDELMGHDTIVQKQTTDGMNDDLVNNALAILNKNERISTSLLQRCLRIGYSDAVSLTQLLEAKGYIETFDNKNYTLRNQ